MIKSRNEGLEQLRLMFEELKNKDELSPSEAMILGDLALLFYTKNERTKMLKDFKKCPEKLTKTEAIIYAKFSQREYEDAEKERIINPKTEEDRKLADWLKASPQVSLYNLFEKSFGEDKEVLSLVRKLSTNIDKDDHKLQTYEFVQEINESRKNQDKAVITYLEKTLGQGIKSTFDDGKGLAIKKFEEIKPFFMFENQRYNQFSKIFLKTFVVNEFFKIYKTKTLSYTTSDACSIYLRYPDVVKPMQFAHDIFCFMTENPHVFSEEDVQDFVNIYVDTLLLRNRHPVHLKRPNYRVNPRIPQMRILDKPFSYHPSKGLYKQERQLFRKIEKYYKEHNFSTEKIDCAINLPLEIVDHCSQHGGHDLERNLISNKKYKLPLQKLKKSKNTVQGKNGETHILSFANPNKTSLFSKVRKLFIAKNFEKEEERNI